MLALAAAACLAAAPLSDSGPLRITVPLADHPFTSLNGFAPSMQQSLGVGRAWLETGNWAIDLFGQKIYQILRK